MEESVAIHLANISKKYRIWSSPKGRLLAPLLCWIEQRVFPLSQRNTFFGLSSRAYYRDFCALEDISISIPKGESLGIIGRNGAGKSTLLQIITGTLRPTSGRVQVFGRVAALLELGSGFNPEFTGRENVFLNGSVLGLSREEMGEKFESICAFANIGDFMDQPVKCYSSGMQLRLAFAVAVHVEPDILIVDEALAVGDARFQLKCARAIEQFLERGVTLLFVSHDLSSVKRLCHTAILLEEGRCLYRGHPNTVVNLYTKLIAEDGGAKAVLADIEKLNRGEAQDTVATDFTEDEVASETSEMTSPQNLSLGFDPTTPGDVVKQEFVLGATLTEELRRIADKSLQGEWDQSAIPHTGSEFSYGGKEGEIVHVSLRDASGEERTWVNSGEEVRVVMVVMSREYFHDPIYAFTLKNKAGVEIYGTNTLFAGVHVQPIHPGERQVVEFHFPMNVMAGAYFLSFGFTHFMGDDLFVVHRRYDAITFDVHAVDKTFGLVNLQARISISSDFAQDG